MPQFSELLGAWGNFYVMIGSSAAALTGLMFVVITLVGSERNRPTRAGVSIFSTPTVFHFGCVLFTAAFMAAPFHAFVPTTVLLGLTGAGGAAYVATVALRGMKLETYQLDAEDFIWHVLLPFVAYGLFAGGAVMLHANPALALYMPAAAVTLLIFVGIHNAWDVVTYVAIVDAQAPSDSRADTAAVQTRT